MTPTLRRLDDRERYWGLTWPGWLAALIAVAVLYGAVRLSPLPLKATVTITLFILAFVAMALYGVSGQALSPGRQLQAILSYRWTAKRFALADRPDRRGLVLTASRQAAGWARDFEDETELAVEAGREAV